MTQLQTQLQQLQSELQPIMDERGFVLSSLLVLICCDCLIRWTEEEIKRLLDEHIKCLHDYNEMKDLAQTLLGMFQCVLCLIEPVDFDTNKVKWRNWNKSLSRPCMKSMI